MKPQKEARTAVYNKEEIKQPESIAAAERKKPAAKPAVKEKPAIKADIEKKSMPAVSRQPVLSAAAESAADKAAAAKNVKAEKAVGAKDTERMMKAEAPREIPAAKAQISAAESRKEGEKPAVAEGKPAEKIPVKIEKTNLAPAAAEERKPVLQPLIPVAEEEPAADVIAFAGSVFELSAENTARLAAIADGFKRPGESKILIYAYNFKFKKAAFAIILLIMTMPTQVSALGFLQLISKMGLKNSFIPLIVPSIAAPTVFFFMKQYLDASLPMEIVEAARIDGAGEFYTFNKIVLPIMKPALAVQAIFSFVASWNNYFIPALVLDTADKKTLPILIAQLRSADFLKFDMGKVYMMVAIAILPVIVVYLLLSKFIVRGVALGGVKG